MDEQRPNVFNKEDRSPCDLGPYGNDGISMYIISIYGADMGLYQGPLRV